jgi:predicted enzyme related to lactoylglutathione lyase
MGNPIGWFEVVGRDTAALKGFYGKLFDWKFEDMTEMPYTIVDPGGENGLRGGIGADPSGGAGHVTFYVSVEELDRSLARVEELGGKTLVGPMDIPNGRIAHVADPEGHMVGLLEGGGS